MGLGEIVHHGEGEQALDESHRRQHARVGQHHLERAHVPRHAGEVQRGEAAPNAGEVPHHSGLHPEHVRDEADHHDGHEGGGHGFGDQRQEVDARHGGRGEGEHPVELHPRHVAEHAVRRGRLEVLELREADHNGEAVDKPQHHRLAHQADHLAHPQHARGDLQQPHEHDSREHVFHAVLPHQADHHHGRGPRGAGDHPGPPPHRGGHQAHEGRRVEPH
mmetsp:Transcript_52682/g.167451  ORF Transcript_52682/g.167451 Transcript_52682/m.167451 type:complete len:219 (-) Transcript_52682:694-1350(-)